MRISESCIDFPKYINGALYIMPFRCRKYFPSIEYAIANECQKALSSKILLMALRKYFIFSYLNKYDYAKTARRYYLLECKYVRVEMIWKEDRYLYQAIQSRYSSFASMLSRKVTSRSSIIILTWTTSCFICGSCSWQILTNVKQ